MSRDVVTPELHEHVLNRDRICIAARVVEGHQCRDQWGNPHRPDDLARLQLDHVQDGYGRLGRRAPSDARHLVAICAGAHILSGGPSRELRAAERAYLARVEP